MNTVMWKTFKIILQLVISENEVINSIIMCTTNAQHSLVAVCIKRLGDYHYTVFSSVQRDVSLLVFLSASCKMHRPLDLQWTVGLTKGISCSSSRMYTEQVKHYLVILCIVPRIHKNRLIINGGNVVAKHCCSALLCNVVLQSKCCTKLVEKLTLHQWCYIWIGENALMSMLQIDCCLSPSNVFLTKFFLICRTND